MVERLLALQSRGRSIIQNGRTAAAVIVADSTLRREIEVLYQYYFGRLTIGCRNCYYDALVQLCYLSEKTARMKSEKFVMRRGKILKDTVNRDARLNLVRGNETDELVLYHLYTNPRAIQWFEKTPDPRTLKKLVTEFGKRYEAERKAQAEDIVQVSAETESSNVPEEPVDEAVASQNDPIFD